MRTKKLLSLTLSAAMIMAPMTTVGATTQSANQTEITDSTSAGSVATTVTASGNTLAVSKNQYKVVLPTNKALDFVLDPQGLLALDSATAGTSKTLDELAAEAGLIRPASTSINAAIQNKSSMPIIVSVDAYIDSSSLGSGSNTINVVTTSQNDVQADDNPNMLIAAVPSKADTLTSKYAPSRKGIVLKAAGSTNNPNMEFYLDSADWEVSGNSTTSYTANYVKGGSGTSFVLNGFVNTKAEWADVTTKPSVKAAFTFDAAPSVVPDMDTNVGAYALVSENSTTSGRDYAVMAALNATKSGKVQIVNGDGIRKSDGAYGVNLYCVQSSSTIDTSVAPTVASLTATNATYDGLPVKTMNTANYTWNNKTGILQFNTNVVNSLKADKQHLVVFFVLNDGSGVVLKSNEVVF